MFARNFCATSEPLPLEAPGARAHVLTASESTCCRRACKRASHRCREQQQGAARASHRCREQQQSHDCATQERLAIIASLRLIPRAGAMTTKRVARVLPPTPDGIERAGGVLRSGGLCAFPTETVYGLGASALDERAVRRVFEVKERPSPIR